MKIIKEILSEDCFDGNFIKEYTLDEKVTLDFIHLLKKFGEVTLLDGLKQPFYSFDKKFFFTIKGLINEKKIKVIFRRNNMDITMAFLEKLLELYPKNDEKKYLEIVEIEKSIVKQIKSRETYNKEV